jgi:protein arginine N-methyltransferase 5
MVPCLMHSYHAFYLMLYDGYVQDPVHLRAGDELVVNFWRVVSPKSVWYEWCISAPVPVPVHNPAGRSYSIGL